MTQAEISKVLRLHELWIKDKGGKRADLQDANLRGAVLLNADLRFINFKCSDLCGSDLRGADLFGADIDFSCLPLWCGSLTAHFDDRQLKQIAYHLVKAGLHSKNASPETKRVLSNPDLVEFANGFHRVDECGRIECENTV